MQQHGGAFYPLALGIPVLDPDRKLCLGDLRKHSLLPKATVCLLYRNEQKGGVITYSRIRRCGYYIQINKDTGFVVHSLD